MMRIQQLKENPQVLRGLHLLLCGCVACLLAAAEPVGIPLPLNTAIAAATTPAYGIAVLAGSLFSFALTARQSAVHLCALALTVMLRWLLGIQPSARSAAMSAAMGTLLSVIVFGMAGLLGGTDLLWTGLGSILAGGLAFCIRKVLARFEGGYPLRLHAGDALPFATCYVVLIAALCCVSVFALRLGMLLTAFVLLTAAKRYGVTGGVLCGTLSAMGILMADASAAGYAAILPAAGLFCGWLSGKRDGLMFFCLQGMGFFGMYLSDWETTVANAWVNGLIGGMLFLFLPAAELADKVMQWSDNDADLAALTAARMDFLAYAIGDVRGHAERIANRLTKRNPAAGYAETVCEQVCGKCSYRKACWERNAMETKQQFGVLAEACLGETLTAPFGCLRPEQVTGAFRQLKRQDAAARMMAARMRDTQSLLFTQMRLTEELLQAAGKQSGRQYHRALTRYVSDVLEKNGIPVHAAAVTETAGKRLLVELYMDGDWDADENLVSDCLSDSLEQPFALCGAEAAETMQRMIFLSGGGYTVTTAAAQCAVHEDEPCGDSFDTFTDSEGAFYLAVSDGMGTGKNAAVDARIVLSGFRQLVQSGMECKAAARLINSLMLTKSGEERFATLDVARISTDEGTLTLYKYGAAPTFVRRGNRVTLCQATTAPIGILPVAEPYTTEMQLERGDMLFLLSDGLDDALYPFIRETMVQGGDLQSLAHAVCAKAQRNAGGAPPDDVTVLAASIAGAVVDG